MSWLGDAIREHHKKLTRQVDAEVAAIMLNPPPERIIRLALLAKGQALEIPAEHCSDGLSRLIVTPGQYLAPETLARYQ